MTTARDQVFISYSHQDAEWLEKLQTMLNPMVRNKTIKVWADTQIGVGKIWRDEIEQAIAKAKVAVLLVSPDFLASDFITQHELPPLLDAAKREGLTVLWIPVHDSLYEETEIEQYQAAHGPKHPLAALGLAEQNTVLKNIAKQIKAALLTRPFSPKTDAALGRPTSVPPPDPSGTCATNPFDPWTPAVPPQFVGRVSLLRRLGDALDTARSVSIVGDWRIGKSSLLATWAQQARARGREIRCVSGEGPEGVSIGTFVKAITGLETAGDADEAANGVDRWANAVGQPGLPPLVLIDEADGLFVRFDHRFFVRLRGMLGRICLVLASRREIDQVCRELDLGSPFLNRLELARVGLLKPDAADALIGRGKSYFVSNDAGLLRHWAGHHPFYLQLLGHHLVQARRNGEGEDYALDRFYDEARIRLRELWQVLDERDRQALRDGAAGLTVRRRPLRMRGLVTADGKLFGEILAEWLREEAP